MIVFLCYMVLYLITLYVIITSYRIIKKTSSFILVLPIVAMYYWSIYGAWSWIPMKQMGGYDFYETIMFPVNVDEFYLGSLLLYSLFIIVFTTYMLYIANNESRVRIDLEGRRRLYRNLLDILGKSKYYRIVIYFSFVFFVYFSYKDVTSAISQGVSAYTLSRFDSSIGAIGTIVSFCGDVFLLMSVPLLFINKKLILKLDIIVPMLLYFGVNLFLGNRNTMLCGVAEGLVLSVELYGVKKMLRLRNIVIVLFAVICIQAVSVLRGMSVSDIVSGNFELNVFDMLGSANDSHEKYAAHISMYGVLKYDVPFTYGTSIIGLLSTIIPSFLGIKRPDDIYMYYVMQTTHTKPDIGMTLHHATGWYLNFGLLGIIAGALLWGYVVKRLYIKKYNFTYLIGSVLFSAVSIQMIRGGGIESYKGVLLMNTIIPMIIVNYCLKKECKNMNNCHHSAYKV